MPASKKDLLLEPIPLTEPAPARPPWFGVPGIVALIAGAVFGVLFGGIVGDLISPEALGFHFPVGEVGGALFGMLAGVVFVLAALLLYRFIRDATSGALVLGLLGLIAMGLVGGLFGAVIGLLAGLLLGAVFGVVKAQGGLTVGPARYPNQTVPFSPWGPGAPPYSRTMPTPSQPVAGGDRRSA
jgi:hypothetical protein